VRQLFGKELEASDYIINCTWDSDARIWTVTSEDIHGLVIESESLDALIKRIRTAARELIDLNRLQNNSADQNNSETNCPRILIAISVLA